MAGLRKSVKLSGEHFATLVVYPFSTSLSVIRRLDKVALPKTLPLKIALSLLEDRGV